ncbi:MAG: tetratricopeptide repeat protein, partial [Candidatus Brocadiae bacterium]|nr:tetratricopeptide repeat protein [Candidatus Brocadiia bacterium]
MPPPRGTVALAFTDIEGSTRLWERLGDRFAPVLARHHALLREALGAAGGHEVKTEGDAFMVAFSSAADAVRFAFLSQEALARERWPAETGEIRVRMGVHVGAPIVVEEADGRVDYLGPMVNRAARVAATAQGGQILLSTAAWEGAREALAGAHVRDLGEFRLKGLEGAERLWQAMPAALAGRTFAPPASTAPRPTNLPAPATTFVGRERELRELGGLFTAPAPRLVTLSGPGGTGKTRLAQRLGAELLDQFPGGVWFADLTEARDAAGVAHAVAAALGAPLSTTQPPARQVAAMLAFRPPLLLILDNFEQVVDAAPQTAGSWLAGSPGLRILATSRFLLGLAGEQEFALEPLPSPARPDGDVTPAGIAAFDGVRLFLDRAREVRPDFTLTASNARAVATLCAELDGMPLALELAAARLRIYTIAEIVERLADRFRVLASSRRDLTTRQRSLQGAIEWSWSLLAPWERAAFAQLCGFRAGFFLEDAEAVLDLSGFPDAPVAADAVQSLREKSFLRAAVTPRGVRFRTDLSLRAWGEERGRTEPALGAGEASLRRLAAWMTGRAEGWAEARGEGIIEGLDRLSLERENLLAVVERALAAGDPSTAGRAALALERALAIRGPWDLRVPLLSPVCAALPEGPLRVRVGTELARAFVSSGRLQDAAKVMRETLPAARTCGSPRALAETLRAATNITYAVGDQAGSLALAREMGSLSAAANLPDVAVWAAIGTAGARDAMGESRAAREEIAAALQTAPADLPLDVVAWGTFSLGILTSSVSEPAEAIRLMDKAATLWTRLGCLHLSARARGSSARFQLRIGASERAMETIRSTIDDLRHAGDPQGAIWSILNLAEVLKRLGRNGEALVRARESEDLARRSDLPRETQDALSERGFILLRLDRLDEAEAVFREAEALAGELKEPARLARTQTGLARVLQGRGNLGAALDLVRSALSHYEDSGNRSNAAAVASGLSSLLLALRRFPEALEAAEKAIRYYGETGERSLDLPAAGMRIVALLEMAKPAEAVAAATQSLGRPDLLLPQNFEHRCDFLITRAAGLRALGRETDARADDRAVLDAWRAWSGEP